MRQKLTVLEVYRKVLERADHYRELAHSKKKPIQGSWTAEETFTSLAQELYHVAMELEQTPEVNPEKTGTLTA